MYKAVNFCSWKAASLRALPSLPACFNLKNIILKIEDNSDRGEERPSRNVRPFDEPASLAGASRIVLG